jgi:PAS domain S-box-containing protein
MSSIEGIRQRLESLFAGVSDAIPTTGPLTRALRSRDFSRPRGWVWELDLAGNYSWCSPEIERILGFTPEEILGKQFHTIGMESQSSETVRALMEQGGPIQQLVIEAQHRDGRTFQLLIRSMHRVDAAGEPLGYRGVAQLTDSVVAAPERMVVELPTPSEKIGATTPATYAPSWGDLLGFEDVEGQIRPLLETIDPVGMLSEDRGDRLVIPLQVQDEIIGVIELEQKEDGSPWLEDERALANAIAHELAITLQDARAYQLTQQALEEMREVDRLKSQFLANMSHELRTPLNSIIGFSRVILKGIDGPITDTQEQDLNAIYNAGHHLLGLINNILDISKIEAGKMELAFTDIDLGEIIRGVMATAVGLVKDKPIELIVDIPEHLPMVQADNIRIRQVLLNLVSNAAKFTEEGHIGVSARTIQRGRRNELVIAVFDTGPGIDLEDQERIFEPFSQVDASPTRKTGGTGLGLSISRHLVALHDGVIWVESIPGEGSTFAFTLPFEPELQTMRAATPLVLGVDHDPTALLHYRESLEGAGYRFHALSRPDQTIDVLRTLRPQALLLDLLGDEIPALPIIAEISRDPALRNIPVMLANLDENSDSGTLFPVGTWISAPFSDEELCASLGHILPQSDVLPRVLVLEQDPGLWSSLLKAVETHECAELLRAQSLQEMQTILQEKRPDAILMNLVLADNLSTQGLKAARSLAGSDVLPIMGYFPATIPDPGFIALQNFANEYQEENSRERTVYLDQIVTYLQQRVPVHQ